jgi:hypothetical protein
MRRSLCAFLFAAGVGMLPAPQPADAVIVECLGDSVSSCNDDFGGSDPQTVAIRGWCYLIRWAMC